MPGTAAVHLPAGNEICSLSSWARRAGISGIVVPSPSIVMCCPPPRLPQSRRQAPRTCRNSSAASRRARGCPCCRRLPPRQRFSPLIRRRQRAPRNRSPVAGCPRDLVQQTRERVTLVERRNYDGNIHARAASLPLDRRGEREAPGWVPANPQSSTSAALTWPLLTPPSQRGRSRGPGSPGRLSQRG